ncbi:MAG: internal scaffolding protein [Microviridae sp.]|nr:MAG: internal scaffolding protein [Microviridae sp.]
MSFLSSPSSVSNYLLSDSRESFQPLTGLSPHRQVCRFDFSANDTARPEFKAECDINTIMSQYRASGVLPKFALKHEARYGDVPALTLQEALDVTTKAREQFMEMPADQREFFDNDPVNFLTWIQDPANEDVAIEQGFYSPEGAERVKARRAAAQQSADGQSA